MQTRNGPPPRKRDIEVKVSLGEKQHYKDVVLTSVSNQINLTKPNLSEFIPMEGQTGGENAKTQTADCTDRADWRIICYLPKLNLQSSIPMII